MVLHSPDDCAAVTALREAVASGRLPLERMDRSVRRILEMKARLGLHAERTVPLERVADLVGGRASLAVARSVSERSITLLRDAEDMVPLRIPNTARVLHLSVVDYRLQLARRRAGPKLRACADDALARRDADRAVGLQHGRRARPRSRTRSAARRDTAVALYVRAASGSGRLTSTGCHAPAGRAGARGIGRAADGRLLLWKSIRRRRAAGNRRSALTYDFDYLAETSAVRALTGEIPSADAFRSRSRTWRARATDCAGHPADQDQAHTAVGKQPIDVSGPIPAMGPPTATRPVLGVSSTHRLTEEETRRIAIGAVLLVVGATTAAQQPEYRVAVRLVEVEARVTDGSGRASPACSAATSR